MGTEGEVEVSMEEVKWESSPCCLWKKAVPNSTLS